jgi:hypothetical protein
MYEAPTTDGQVGSSRQAAMKSRTGRALVAAGAFLASIACLLGTERFITHIQSDDGLDGINYAEKIRQSYNFRFGKDNISLPGNAAIEGNQFIQAGAFPPPEY